MKIVLGTSSTKKPHYLKSVIYEAGDTAEIQSLPLISGVSDQPMSLDETLQGATNRAIGAYKKVLCDLGAGIEGGMEMINDDMYYFGIVVFFDGEFTYTGISDFVALPKRVSELVKTGKDAGDETYKYLEEHADDHGLQEAVMPIANRKHFFDRAISNAWTMYKNKKHFI